MSDILKGEGREGSKRDKEDLHICKMFGRSGELRVRLDGLGEA